MQPETRNNPKRTGLQTSESGSVWEISNAGIKFVSVRKIRSVFIRYISPTRIWDKVFKNGPNKICRSLKNFEGVWSALGKPMFMMNLNAKDKYIKTCSLESLLTCYLREREYFQMAMGTVTVLARAL